MSCSALSSRGRPPSLLPCFYPAGLLSETSSSNSRPYCPSALSYRSIADVIMEQYGADRWGDFKVRVLSLRPPCSPPSRPSEGLSARAGLCSSCNRVAATRPRSRHRPPVSLQQCPFRPLPALPSQGTLLGLLTACGAELSILKCAHRVVAAGGRLEYRQAVVGCRPGFPSANRCTRLVHTYHAYRVLCMLLLHARVRRRGLPSGTSLHRLNLIPRPWAPSLFPYCVLRANL